MSNPKVTILDQYRNYIGRLERPLMYLQQFGNSFEGSGAIHVGPPPPPPLHELVATLAHMQADLSGLIELAREMDAQGMLRGD
jgi:hypothetical protein